MIAFFRKIWITLFDLAVTLLLWGYFLFGFLLLFSPFYLAAYFFSGNRENAFQVLNHRFFRGFFALIGTIIPFLEIRMADEVPPIRSSVIVCNHLSYLDPLLMISIFARHKTIVKSTFFKTPVFGWIVRASGYIPMATNPVFSSLMIKHLEELKDFFNAGGNLFIFPEGTRNRDRQIGHFSKGAFQIARSCRVPIRVLAIKSTNRLFPPGRFLFAAHHKNTIEIQYLGSIEPMMNEEKVPVKRLMQRTRSLFEMASGADLFSESA